MNLIWEQEAAGSNPAIPTDHKDISNALPSVRRCGGMSNVDVDRRFGFGSFALVLQRTQEPSLAPGALLASWPSQVRTAASRPRGMLASDLLSLRQVSRRSGSRQVSAYHGMYIAWLCKPHRHA
jgi:hypothetical protein